MIFAVLSLVITLWNANTSYETSPKFLTSRSHFCEHFKDLRINNTGGTVVHFSDCWDTQMLWEVSLGTMKYVSYSRNFNPSSRIQKVRQINLVSSSECLLSSLLKLSQLSLFLGEKLQWHLIASVGIPESDYWWEHRVLYARNHLVVWICPKHKM